MTTTVVWDFVPNQTVWVITDSGVESGVINRAEVVNTGAGQTVSYFIKIAGDSIETRFDETDVFASCQAAEGYQVVSFGGVATLAAVAVAEAGSPLADTLQATVSFSGGTAINLELTGPNLTFQDVITSLQFQIGGAGVVALVGGNIRFTNANNGVAATVLIIDDDLFSSLNLFVRVDDPIVGDDAGAIETYSAQIC